MKKLLIFILVVSMGAIAYFFIREQFEGVVLSREENTFLSGLYLVVGIAVLILARIKYAEDRKK
jgi:hypothetical protein